MPTPAYTNLDSNKPSGSDSPTTYATDNLNNIRALRDMVITGRAAGFVQSRTQGTGPDVARPQYITWLNSSLQVGFRMKSTWGGTGNCQQTSVEWEWTNDNGSSWTTLGTAQANTFDANDNITASTYSGGFVTLVLEMWTKLLRYVGAIKVDAATNNVGIGTSSPSNRLHVKQSADNSAAGFGARIERSGNDSILLIGYRDNTDTWQYNATYTSTGAFKPLTFHTSDTERMRIDSSGNVGIGTSSPSVKLEVNGNITVGNNTNIAHTFKQNNDTAVLIYSDAANQVTLESARASNSATKYDFYFNKYGGNSFFGGNVGIGTSSPGVKLDVSGTARSNLFSCVYNASGSSETSFGADAYEGATFKNSFLIGWSVASDYQYIGNYQNFPLVFLTNWTERFRITEDGRLYGKALHNNAGSVTGTTNQYIASGTMANGNATAVTNVSGTPTYQTMTWMRVGNVVTVAGTVTAAATTANTACSIRFPPPIASAFTVIEDCAGSGTWTTGDNGEPVRVRADEINDEISVRWVPTSTTNTVMPIHFTYLIK